MSYRVSVSLVNAWLLDCLPRPCGSAHIKCRACVRLNGPQVGIDKRGFELQHVKIDGRCCSV